MISKKCGELVIVENGIIMKVTSCSHHSLRHTVDVSRDKGKDASAASTYDIPVAYVIIFDLKQKPNEYINF